MTDSIDTTIARRSILKGIAAVPLAAGGAAAQTDELQGLIDAHRAVHDAFIAAIDHEQEMKKAYKATYPERLLVPVLPGSGGWE
jgi:hypothetical protein